MNPALAAAAAAAFLDGSGKQLLAVNALEAPEQYTRAVCGDGKPFEVRWVKHQPKGEKDSGRLTERNFDQSEGELFEVTGAPAKPDVSSCLVASEAFFAARKVVKFESRGEAPCDGKTSAAVAKALGARKLERCVQRGTLGPSVRLVVAERRDGETRTAVLALAEGAKVAVKTFDAKQTEPNQPSCWRADDGCAFEPAAFKVPFLLKGKAGTELFFLWDGFEGQNIELLKVSDKKLEGLWATSRYWAPE